MNDMSAVITPKSDQINADDLIAGPRTITIRDVQISGGQEQPVSIYFEGSDKAFRPCKSMSRVLVAVWGPDAKVYVGRSLTLFRDPAVKWGGLEVGGIRISHLSHMEAAKTLALTATKGSRKPYTIKPLAMQQQAAVLDLEGAREMLCDAVDLDALQLAWRRKDMAPFREQLQPTLDERKAALSHEPEGPADEDRGERITDELIAAQ